MKVTTLPLMRIFFCPSALFSGLIGQPHPSFLDHPAADMSPLQPGPQSYCRLVYLRIDRFFK